MAALTIFVVAVALLFDFINGFHDSANSIATVVATRVLKPFQAVLWAAFFNLVAAFFLGTGVASSISKDYVDMQIVTPYVVLAGIAGCGHLGPDYVVAGFANEFFPRADRWLCRSGDREGRSGWIGPRKMAHHHFLYRALALDRDDTGLFPDACGALDFSPHSPETRGRLFQDSSARVISFIQLCAWHQ